jgi:hypothetical protein
MASKKGIRRAIYAAQAPVAHAEVLVVISYLAVPRIAALVQSQTMELSALSLLMLVV